MSEASNPPGWLAPLRSCGPRGGIVALAAAHFVLAVLHAWAIPVHSFGESWWWLAELLVPALDAIPQAQIALIAVFLVLGSGRVVPRLVRAVLLLLWVELAHMIGTRWLAGGRDALGFEESLGINAWHFAFVALSLLVYRLIAQRQLARPAAATRARLQFRIIHLLIVTTEAAALLAAIRAFVVENDEWRDELWRSLRDYLPQYAIYDLLVLMLLCVLPAVLISLHARSAWRAALALLLWVPLLITGFTAYRFTLYLIDPQLALMNPGEPAWMWGTFWLNHIGAYLSMTLVIWLTLTVVRLLGYDFLPVGGGRQSSEATSAA